MIIDRNVVKENLSNFYRDHGYNTDAIEHMVDLYFECGEMMLDYVEGCLRNQTVKSMECFRKYNFASAPTAGATYRIEDMVNDPEFSALGGLSAGTQAGRIEQWDQLSREEKERVLTVKQLYIPMTAKRVFDDAEPVIVSADVSDYSKKSLLRNIDYSLSGNKLFLLGTYAAPSIHNHTLVLTNIFVDYGIPERLVGSRVGVGYNSSISKAEYRDFMQMVAKVLLSGPKHANIQDALNLLAGWKGSKVTDRVSATGVRKDLWERPGYAILTPFDFLVTVPASVVNTVGFDANGQLTSRADRIDIFKRFLEVARPDDTNFMLALSENILELIPPIENMFMKEKMPLIDQHLQSDNEKNNIGLAINDEFKHNQFSLPLTYDNSENYDEGRPYDEAAYMSRSVDMGWGDMFVSNHITYPEFPINFSASLNGNRDVIISLKDSAASVEGYEVYMDEAKIHEFTSTGGGNVLSFTYTGFKTSPAGPKVFCAKSFYTAGTRKYSRPSAKVTINN